MKAIQIISIILIAILSINLVLFALGKINQLAFWLIVIICGIASYIISKQKR